MNVLQAESAKMKISDMAKVRARSVLLHQKSPTITRNLRTLEIVETYWKRPSRDVWTKVVVKLVSE